MSLPLNYAYVLIIIAIAFNDVSVAALTMSIIVFTSQVHEVKGSHN